MLTDFIKKQSWQLYHDRDNLHHEDPLSSLVYQDAFIRYLPEMNQRNHQHLGIIHLYPYQTPTVLLGGKDTRLPQAQKGYDFLRQSGYQCVIRPHGGLAVVNDPGIINFAIVTDMSDEKIAIDQAYEYITELVQEILRPYGLTVNHYEVPRSYCPGKYDLVVNGQKIGGTAQRRFKDGLTTAAYLSLNGDQRKRAELIRQFYEISDADESYPDVDWKVMTTIEDCIAETYSQKDFEQDLLRVFNHYSRIESHDFTDSTLSRIYKEQYPSLQKRNRKFLT
ncbi:hypothetical protein HZY86_04525 [Aerococcaceae bacterium DSM 111020]|nr:hypothetical protein [Aerococcaceae bacterium DSM 111020]